MNEEILQELQRMNDILVGIAIMLLFGLVLWAIKSLMAIYKYGREIRRSAWNDRANALFAQAKFEDLLALAKRQLRKEPKNSTGLYWKSLAEKETNRFEDLKGTVTQLVELSPQWKEDWMDEYIKTK